MYKRKLAYLEEINASFLVKSINILDEEYELLDFGGEDKKVKFDEAELFDEIAEVDGLIIFEEDLYKDSHGNYLKAKVNSVGVPVLILLNDKLEEREGVLNIEINNAVKIRDYEVLGNIKQFKKDLDNNKEKLIDFNVKTGKIKDDYFYICKNEEISRIDLISVSFIGHMNVEEKYTRKTITYEEYEHLLNEGLLTIVTPDELQEYAMNKIVKAREDLEDDWIVAEEVVDECVDLCDDCDCGRPIEMIINSEVINCNGFNINNMKSLEETLKSNVEGCNVENCCGDKFNCQYCEKCSNNISECNCDLWNNK